MIHVIGQLKETYKIKNKDIVGYSETRILNNDPANHDNGVLRGGGGMGPKFDWKYLANHGVGLYHNLSEEQLAQAPDASVIDIQQKLHLFGYSVSQSGQLDRQTQQAIKQFIIHHDAQYYNPENPYNLGRINRILENLLAQHQAEVNQEQVKSTNQS